LELETEINRELRHINLSLQTDNLPDFKFIETMIRLFKDECKTKVLGFIDTRVLKEYVTLHSIKEKTTTYYPDNDHLPILQYKYNASKRIYEYLFLLHNITEGHPSLKIMFSKITDDDTVECVIPDDSRYEMNVKFFIKCDILYDPQSIRIFFRNIRDHSTRLMPSNFNLFTQTLTTSMMRTG
jgi:hypothetical protein